jgi:hypothetical protein
VTAVGHRDGYAARARAACEHAITHFAWSNQIEVIERALLGDLRPPAVSATTGRDDRPAEMLAGLGLACQA